MLDFYTENISQEHAESIVDLRWEYFALAMNRKPEHSAWSRIEQWRAPCESRFSWIHNQEAEKRLERCQKLAENSKSLFTKVPDEAKDAYLQLVHYPIIGSTQSNEVASSNAS